MAWIERLRNALRPGSVQRDIDRELAFHLAEREDDLRLAGLSDEEAARRARVQLGNPAVQAERTRDVDVAVWVDALRRNIRQASRALARTPGVTVTIVAMLAVGIGANTAVFSAIDAVLLRQLPFPDGDRLMRITQTSGGTDTMIAPVRLEDWNALSATFEAISGYYTEDVSETSGDLPERVRRAHVAPRFVRVWGVPPALGRDFTEDEHRFGGPRALLISHRYWQARFRGDRHVLQREVHIDGVPFAIVGVMPASFHFLERDVDIWTPTPVDAPFTQFRRATWYVGIGRLRPAATLEQARADLTAVQTRLAEQYPESDRDIAAWVTPLKEMTVMESRASLWLVFGAVTVLLMIACTNIAGLLVSRALHRRPEIAVRLSLGASRGTVVAQMLTEVAILASVGAVLGLLLAVSATRALRAGGVRFPRIEEISVDGRILLYTLLCTVVVTMLCGLIPALRSVRNSLVGAMAAAGRSQLSSQRSPQWLLVGVQIALSVTLLAGAGLLVRSVLELSRVNRGFDSSQVLTFRMSGSFNEWGDPLRVARRIERTLEVLQALPGAVSAAAAWSPPGVPERFEQTFESTDGRARGEQRDLVAASRGVSPGYFATLQIPVLEGELCRAEPVGSPQQAMVNRTFARRHFPGATVVGSELRVSGVPNAQGVRVAGVVGDVREQGLDREPDPTVYMCASAPNPMPHFFLRTHGDPAAMAQTVRLALKEIEPLRSIYDMAALEERIGDAYAADRFRMLLLVLFALTALALACIGVYGTLSYTVSLRRREVGVRLALGAFRSTIVRQFLRHGLQIVCLACACGVALALAASHALAGMLYGVSPYDPLTLSAVVAIVLAVATVAALVPAARAAFVEPMRILREE